MPKLRNGKYHVGLRIGEEQFRRLEALRASCSPIPTRTDLILQLIDEASTAHLESIACVQGAPAQEEATT